MEISYVHSPNPVFDPESHQIPSERANSSGIPAEKLHHRDAGPCRSSDKVPKEVLISLMDSFYVYLRSQQLLASWSFEWIVFMTMSPKTWGGWSHLLLWYDGKRQRIRKSVLFGLLRWRSDFCTHGARLRGIFISAGGQIICPKRRQ